MEDHQKHLITLDSYLTLKNFSKATRSSYGSALGQFLVYREAQKMDTDFTTEQARSYLLYRYNKGLKWQTINGDYSAMYKFYRYVLGVFWDVHHIPRPRRELTLPRILSQQEVQRLIEHGSNVKNQVFMSLLYATGLRLSEALNLRLSDIHSDRLQIRVLKGKGAKDRYVAIPKCLLDLLRKYYLIYRPKNYLFNGYQLGKRWANRSGQHCVKIAAKAAKIERAASPHVLRHCYATHHLENGTSLVYLKEQMGRQCLKTTAKYIRLCETYRQKVHHPIASMEIKYHPKVR